MPYSKSQRAEKISTETLAAETLDVIHEMLNIMVERIRIDNNDMEFSYSGGDLKYFGVGHQIKISKLADTLYSTLKDVLVFVIEEMAKNSEVDFKFQVPKHTSFVGSIVKNVAIDVIAHNPSHKAFLDHLCFIEGKYIFDNSCGEFQAIYRDTVLKLAERGYLFEDDPELLQVQREVKDIHQISRDFPSNPLATLSLTSEDMIAADQNGVFSSIRMSEETNQTEEDYEMLNDFDAIKSNCRNRVILPYLRRLFETQKASRVTRKRVESVVAYNEPDEEIKAAFNEKYSEILRSSQKQDGHSQDVLRGHCVFLALTYLKDHYPKERVDAMEDYLKTDRSSSSKNRKRYVKVASGKRPHFMDAPADFAAQLQPEVIQTEGFLPLN